MKCIFWQAMPAIIQTRQLFQSATGSPLGRITLAGTIRGSRGVPETSMRVLGSYAVVYLLDGSGFFKDARGYRKNVGAGDLILLFPDVAHAYGPLPRGHWDEIHLVFDGPVFDLWRKRGLLSPAEPIYHLEPIGHWLRHFENLIAPNVSALDRICWLQSALASALTDYQRDPATARDEEWLASASALLGASIGGELYVEDVARRLKLSPETFRKKFTRLAGVPPWRYHMTRVIEHGCRLVHEGLLTNKEIAAQLGFNDEFHFSRRFKQITGRSPTQFRALSAPGKIPRIGAGTGKASDV
jgi:AraC-like DNA-binding protein